MAKISSNCIRDTGQKCAQCSGSVGVADEKHERRAERVISRTKFVYIRTKKSRD